MEAATTSPPARRDRITTPRTETAETTVQSAVADPAPLGLAGFALTTFVLSMFNAGLVGAAGEPVVFGLALAYGGVAQLLAGMWEFKNGNAFGATAFTSFGAFWISFWALQQFFVTDIPKAELGDAVGLFLIAWAIFTAYMWVASFRVSVAVNLVFFLLTITFVLLGIGESSASDSLVKAGGWFGLATAAVAWYASFAIVTNKTFGREVLPVRPLTGK